MTLDEFISTQATRLGVNVETLRSLVLEAFACKMGESREIQQVVTSGNALEQLRELVQANRDKWEAEDTAEVVRHCPAMPDAAALSSDERMRHIHDQELRGLAQRMPTTTGALLLGNTALGKSLTAVEIVSRVIREHRAEKRNADIAAGKWWNKPACPSVWMVHATQIAQCVEFGRLKFDSDEPESSELLIEPTGLKLWSTCEWLAIDDLGWESRTGRDALKHVLNERYSHGLPTVATSGWRLADLEGEYGDALIRRVHERRGERGIIVELFGETASP